MPFNSGNKKISSMIIKHRTYLQGSSIETKYSSTSIANTLNFRDNDFYLAKIINIYTNSFVVIIYHAGYHDVPVIISKGMDTKTSVSDTLLSVKHSPFLAERLYRCFDIGDEITEDLYEEVAEVLAEASK